MTEGAAPIGWSVRRLAEIVSPVTTKVAGRKDPNLPYVGLEQIASGTARLLGTLPSSASTSTNNVFSPGDVLFGKLRPNLRKTARMTSHGYCSTDVLVLRAQPGYDSTFCGHLLASDLVFRQALRTAEGTKMPRTSWPSLSRLEVMVPTSQDEQAAIAACLDALDREIDLNDAALAKLSVLGDGLRQDLFEVRGHGWPRKTLAELSFNKGDYGAGAAARPYQPTLPRYVRITDIQADGRLSPTSLASVTEAEGRGYEISVADLLFARSGATVGKTYLYNPADGRCVHAGYVIKFSLDPSKCDPRFVSHFTRSDGYWRWVGRTLRQGAQPNINASEYRSLEVLCPGVEEQRAIADVLDAHDRVVFIEERRRSKLAALRAGVARDVLGGQRRVSGFGPALEAA
jgi:type I restriction enzyme S subunit